MSEPCVDVEDVEESSNVSESDEEDSESETSSTSSVEEDSSSSSPSSSRSSLETAESDEDIWSLEENTETEEAQEVSLHDEFMKALRLIVDGYGRQALRIMNNILNHPLLAKYNVDVDSFEWESARNEARENALSISTMAHLYASLHYHIGMLGDDPIKHYFCALTVYVNDDSLWLRLGDCAMERRDWPVALFAFENASGWRALNGTLICMYKQRLYIECLTKLVPVLAIDKHYTLGLAIKRAIRNFGPYWEARCREIFHEDPAYDEPDDPATSMLYDELIEKLDRMGSPEPEKQPDRRMMRIDRKLCANIADIGTLLCNAYDNMENYGSLAMDVVIFVENEVTENGDNMRIVQSIVEELIDCICILEAIVEEVVNKPLSNSDDDLMVASRKRKRPKPSFEWSRRSTRFRAEFNIDDSGAWRDESSPLETVVVLELLRDACVLERSIKPLKSIKCATRAESMTPELSESEPRLVSEEFLVRQYLENVVEIREGEDIFTAIKRLLLLIAMNPYRWRIPAETRKVLVECYLRWVRCESHDCAVNESNDAYVHLLGAELGCRTAIFKCASFIGVEGLSRELAVRLHWMLALNHESSRLSQQCYAHLTEVRELLSDTNESPNAYASLVNGHDCINLHYTHSLLDLQRREEILGVITEYFSHREFLKTINLIETSFDWAEADQREVESTVLILVDSYIGIGNFNEAAHWLSRAIDYMSAFSSIDEALQRVHQIDIRAVEHECVSNLVHCIAPLLMSEPYKMDLSLWIFLYEAARVLEGEHTVESLNALYQRGSLMLNSSLNVLVTAHDMLAGCSCCSAENYRFLMFELRELARVRSERCVIEALSNGQHAELLRAFIDEVHQCMFCMFGCPSRWKRVLEGHGSAHAYEPSHEDAMCIISLLMPDTLPSYYGTLYPDLIEIVQKKLTAFMQPTEEEITKLDELNEFVKQSQEGDWPRCTTINPLRSQVFYMLAMNSYRWLRIEETLQYAKLFLVTSKADVDTEILHSAWTILAFLGVVALFELNEDELMKEFSTAIFYFRMALFFGPGNQDVLFNFGSALYQIRSKLSRFKRKLELDDIRRRWIRIHTRGMLEESQKLFTRCASLLPDGHTDRWRCHYFLAKIANKCGNPVELHYLAYAYLFKWLLTDIDWRREQLVQMLSFAQTFSYHGVCRRNVGHDLFAVAPEIRSCVAEIIYRTHIADMDDVTRCMEKMLERIQLIDSILASCNDGFEVCIKRFPHFKSYYRLSQIAFYRGDFSTASALFFNRLFAKKRSNNPDNIFERLSSPNFRDYLLPEDLKKVYNFACLGLIRCVSEKILCGEDSTYLVPLLYDLYQYAERFVASLLIGGVGRILPTRTNPRPIALSLTQLCQLQLHVTICSGGAFRNNEKTLCLCLRKCLSMMAPHLDGFVTGSDPMDVAYQLYVQSKQKATKRRSKPITVPVAPKTPRYDTPSAV
uniref:TPR_REGION domain-containing protein n=1 Tax=Ascaris lumbricoides TaxID=6252 RepID=A0A0M3HR25_ASCLU